MERDNSAGKAIEQPLKMVMIIANEGLMDFITEAFRVLGIRGYTRIDNVKGEGSIMGEPHLGTHIWPGINLIFIVVANATTARALLDEVRKIDEKEGEPGIRAFLFNVEAIA